MRHPKGKPHGFTTALMVWVMVSTNCTWGGKRGRGEGRAEPTPATGASGPVAINYSSSLNLAGIQQENAKTAHYPTQKSHLKLY